MLFWNLAEGVAVALENLRSNKLRSFLTILGVVIGVATVMLMASIVDGVRTQVFNALNAATPNAFYVMRFFSQTPLNPQNLPYEVRIRPIVDAEDADAIRREPSVRHAGLWLQSFVRIEYQDQRSQGVWVLGADDAYMEIKGGTVAAGRFFTQGELNGAEVTVLELELSRRLFGQRNALGETVKIHGKPFRVIGLWQQ
ncbi:MAG TPA: ABC transporter permease, partial [Gemmatimonadales bacterium]|nr:ABC transporter permease [Gemmatimonadales bacterium]